jgi:hypothetical protein
MKVRWVRVWGSEEKSVNRLWAIMMWEILGRERGSLVSFPVTKCVKDGGSGGRISADQRAR